VSAGGAPPSWTPAPSPTAFTPGPPPYGAPGFPPPVRPAIPPPLPGLEPPPRRRGKRLWWVWVGAAFLIASICGRDRSKTHREAAHPSPAPAAAEGEVDGQARVAHDTEIETAVQRALHANPRTRRQDIEVDVDEATVTLSGHATADAAREAEVMARHVDGVHGVVNTIDVQDADTGGPGPHGVPGPGDIQVPPVPPRAPHGRPGVDQAELRRLLSEGHAAIKAGEPAEAMGKFGAAMGVDPQNEEAREGMKEATILLTQSIGRQVMRGSPSPPK
jgi:hypothetical protein